MNCELPTAAPSVSVIIPAYNCAVYLGAAIDSALAQLLPASEIIVIDDGSTDGTAEVAAQYGSRVQLIRQANGGPAAARNNGIAAARGEWIAFLDGDDAWLPEKLATQWRAVELIGSPALICSATLGMQEPIESVSSGAQPERLSVERLVLRNRIATSTVLVPKAELVAVGGFDARFRGPEDFQCWLKIARRVPVWYLPQALVRYRIAPNSLSQQAFQMRDQELQIVEEFWTDAKSLPARRKRQAQAAVHLRAAITLLESRATQPALMEVLASLRCWPFSLPEYADRTRLIRLRLLRRIFLAAPTKILGDDSKTSVCLRSDL